MEINWIDSDPTYQYAKLPKGTDKSESIKALILKILELSKPHKDWDLLVLDKWVFNLGRLIGNIQNRDQAIGMDRGFRVGLTFEEYAEGLQKAEDNEDEYSDAIDYYNGELDDLIIEVVQEPTFNQKLKAFYAQHPFSIEVAEQGQRINLTLGI